MEASGAKFVHLHVHTEYSLAEALCGLDDLTEKAATWNMEALAITDKGAVNGTEEEQLGYVCVDEPQFKTLVPPVVRATSRIGYVRFHKRRISGNKSLTRGKIRSGLVPILALNKNRMFVP